MSAAVVLPPGYGTSHARYPVVYHVPGFSSTDRQAWQQEPALTKGMTAGTIPPMLHVFLDPSEPNGHSTFANSDNNGRWMTALVRGFIPHIERVLRADARPSGRFLTGHSSGGWATLWLQVENPRFFGGTWSSAPDSVDYRSVNGVDIYAPGANFYLTPRGDERYIVRAGGRGLVTIRDFTAFERVTGPRGGQLGSLEAVLGPRSRCGLPARLFDRRTGEIDPAVAAAWSRYDISRLLAARWAELGPQLRGRIHVDVGSQDTLYLDQAVALLKDRLTGLGSDARIRILPGLDHFTVDTEAIRDSYYREMDAVARPS